MKELEISVSELQRKQQAAEAFLWWRGVRPETKGLISQLTVPLT